MPLRALAAALLCLAWLSACGPRSVPGEPMTPATPATSSMARSALSRATPSAPAADRAALVAGNNDFAFALHHALRGQPGNLMTSPYSVSLALGMAWAGARGTTETQMAQALHFTLPQAQLHPAFNAIDQALQSTVTCPPQDPTCTPFTFTIANSAWAQQGYPFEPAYLDTLALDYGAGVNLVDYRAAPEPARLAINAWVKQATQDKIVDLLAEGTVSSDTRLVLTNAVYFKGQWQTAFEPAHTTLAGFTLEGGATATVPVMHASLGTRGAKTAAYDAVELRYQSGPFTMLLIAPARGTFAAYETAFDAAKLAQVDAALTSAQVQLSMPKFKFESKASLAQTLSQLGMPVAFTELADFTGLAHTSEHLAISDVIHQANIAVDEKGTEAAAATAVVMGNTSVAVDQLTIDLDRPFLFAIRETTTGQVVFLGRVVDPR